MKEKGMTKAQKVEAYLWAEAIRLHYMSLEHLGAEVYDEALFFLTWHNDTREGLSRK